MTWIVFQSSRVNYSLQDQILNSTLMNEINKTNIEAALISRFGNIQSGCKT